MIRETIIQDSLKTYEKNKSEPEVKSSVLVETVGVLIHSTNRFDESSYEYTYTWLLESTYIRLRIGETNPSFCPRRERHRHRKPHARKRNDLAKKEEQQR